MEDLWKKFKEETRGHIQKINEFLNEISSNEKSLLNEEITKNEKSQMPQPLPEPVLPVPQLPEHIPQNFSQIYLENETSKNSQTRKNNYGKLKQAVKEIMEKEHLSRAQAYRKAKKRILSS